jgi:hypothetical protein
MLLAKFNVIATGGSGVWGDSAVRQRKSKTQVCKRPPKRPGPKKPAQQATINQFKLANQYATTALADPDLRAAYKRAADLSPELVHARNMAVRDYMRAPEIRAVDTDCYTGKPGEQLYILATDDFMVKTVTVAIYDSRNNLIETGAAACIPKKKKTQRFVYTITASVKGSRIMVYAADIPGNVTTQEIYTGTVETNLEERPAPAFTVTDLLKGIYAGSKETNPPAKPISPEPDNGVCFADVLLAAYRSFVESGPEEKSLCEKPSLNGVHTDAVGTSSANTTTLSTKRKTTLSTPALRPALQIPTAKLPLPRFKVRTKKLVDHTATDLCVKRLIIDMPFPPANKKAPPLRKRSSAYPRTNTSTGKNEAPPVPAGPTYVKDYPP